MFSHTLNRLHIYNANTYGANGVGGNGAYWISSQLEECGILSSGPDKVNIDHWTYGAACPVGGYTRDTDELGMCCHHYGSTHGIHPDDRSQIHGAQTAL